MKKLLFAALSLLPSCMQIRQKNITRHIAIAKPSPLNTAIDVVSTQNTVQNPPITIWVHGTRFLPKQLFRKFFYSKPGLHHYAEIESKYQQYKIAKTLITSDPLLFAEPTFYLFGWSGALSFKERKQAAITLYTDLKKVRAEYILKYGQAPVIRIVSHSHGGNIALLLDQVKDPCDKSFFVNELYLLACPAQHLTMHCAYSSTFGRVYSLYSMLDALQVADPQGLQKEKGLKNVPLFSQRFFPTNEKIEQVAIKINNRSIMHMEFIKLKFLAQISSIISHINEWKLNSNIPSCQWATINKCLSLDTKIKKT